MESNSEELINLFEELATPRKEFAESLKVQVVSQIHTEKPQSNFISQLFMKLSQSTLRIGAMVTLLAIGAGVATYSYLSPATKQFANQEEILAKIAQSSANTKRESNTAAPATTLSGQDAKIGALYIRNPEERDYNYKKITTSYDIGGSAAKCSQMIPYQGDVTGDELVQYYSTKDEMFPKYTKNTVYADRDVYDYNLSVDTDQWLYRGGEYAVHLTNVQRVMPLAASAEGVPSNVKTTTDSTVPSDLVAVPPLDTTTTPEPVDPKEVIKNYFGEDAKIIGTDTINGKEYYKVQWSYKSTCGDLSTSPDRSISSSSAEFNQTFVVVAYASQKDYTIDKESYYLDSVANRNLLYTRSTTESKKMVTSFDEIKDEFTYTYAKPVKTIDASAFQYEKEYRKAVLSFVKENLTNVVYLSSKYSLQSIYSNFVTVIPDHEKHLIDRAFYSDKQFGTNLYNESKDMFKPYTQDGKTYPKAQLSYSGTGTVSWLNLSEFPGTVDTDTALSSFGYEGTSFLPKGDMTLTVAGTAISAKVFELQQPSNSTPGNTGEGSVQDNGGVVADPEKTAPEQIMPRIEQTFRDLYVVFTSNDTTVVVQTSVAKKVTNTEVAKSLGFAVINTSDADALSKALPVSVNVVKPELMLR